VEEDDDEEAPVLVNSIPADGDTGVSTSNSASSSPHRLAVLAENHPDLRGRIDSEGNILMVLARTD